ncbi:hypothetical protein BJY01DRAFT_68724 [Aspergillus pseudoustus]|uniref:Uncharacterized protein n=1 Tax=Aspergillus pseudoustus TaxID=1810923 RepID=A0ABR4J6X9_9EURO
MSADEGGGTSMAATNGERSTATPDPSTLATPGKRKRVSSHDEKAAHDASTAVDERIKLQETLRNLVDILSKNDTELQLLSCPLPSSPVKPRSKRAKIAGDRDEAASIQARVASDRYNTLSEFLSDIEKASAAVIERNKTQASGTPTDGTPVTETVNRIAAFKKLLNSLVRQAHVSQSSIKAETPGTDAEASAKQPASTVEVRNNGLVLTLFGNPANPKQLYSSLQKSVKVPLSSEESESKQYVEVQTPLPEGGLPNGITTTKVSPYDEKKPREPTKTFGEVFASKATLPQLEPPRRARSSSRAAQVSWIDPFDAVTNYKNFLGDRSNHSFAQLPSGNWLQYGGVTSSPAFWSRRQKQQTPQHGEEKFHEDPLLWADDDSAVLQGVYSSFAPSFDSSNAVLQADAKNMVWWSKRGAKRLYALLSITIDEPEDTTVQPGSIGDLDESTLEEMVKSFNPDEFADPFIQPGTAKEEEEDKSAKDTDDLLAEVSDLLETLSSYQKIRSLELPTPANPGADGKETPAPETSPDEPSDAEIEVYETLRSSLAMLVSQLPPFAVSKLNGDQLAELNISQKILVDNTDYPGSMEKDDHTIQQERATAAAVAPRTSTPSRPTNFQAQYNQRAFGANTQIQPQRNFQAPPQPYYPPRQPSTPGAYTPGNPQQFPGARPPATATATATPGQRPGYYPQYSQSTPQYNQANPVQYQRPGQNGYTPYAGQPGAAPTPAQGSPQQYTPRPGQQTPYSAAPYGPGRSASPQKQGAFPASRAPYMPPGSNPQQRFMQHPQAPQQPQPYGNYAPKQAPNTYSNSAAAVTYARSAAEQAALMDRNKVQLAAQSSPGTPQSQPPADHRSSQDRSVTPGAKQNGTPVPA